MLVVNGKVLNRPIILPSIPKFVLKIMLGEMSVMLLEGSRVSSGKIINEGFEFTYGDLEEIATAKLKVKGIHFSVLVIRQCLISIISMAIERS